MSNPIKKAGEEVVKELAKKEIKSIGTTLSNILYLVFGDTALSGSKKRLEHAIAFEQFESSLRKKIEQTPQGQLIDPNMQIVGTAIQNARFCIEEESLRNMFVNHIAKSLNTEYKGQVHPSFSEIIPQLSPLDVECLKLIYPSNKVFPLCNYMYKYSSPGGSITFVPHVFLLDGNPHKVFETSMCMVNLSRLGLIEISYMDSLSKKERYEIFTTNDFFQNNKNTTPRNTELDIQEGLGRLTTFGSAFCDVCFDKA